MEAPGALRAVDPAGHIPGIVNLPVNPPKRSATGSANPHATTIREHWFTQAQQQRGSWWRTGPPAHERTGELVPAYLTGNEQFPPLAAAPGQLRAGTRRSISSVLTGAVPLSASLGADRQPADALESAGGVTAELPSAFTTLPSVKAMALRCSTRALASSEPRGPHEAGLHLDVTAPMSGMPLRAACAIATSSRVIMHRHAPR